MRNRRFPGKKFNRQQEAVIAAWRGYDEPDDLKHYEKNVASLVERILKKANLEGRADLEELNALWVSAVGELIAKHSKPEGFRDGILHVNVLQPAVRFQLEGQLKPKVLARVRELFPSGHVKEIRYRLG
jgi:predicted nucleic acid-binding Zn ribbon protein